MDISDSDIHLLAETVRWRGRDEVRIVGANVGHVYVPINAPFYSAGEAQSMVRNRIRAVIHADRSLHNRVETGLMLKHAVGMMRKQVERDLSAHVARLREEGEPPVAQEAPKAPEDRPSQMQRDLMEASNVLEGALAKASMDDLNLHAMAYSPIMLAALCLRPHRVVEF